MKLENEQLLLSKCVLLIYYFQWNNIKRKFTRLSVQMKLIYYICKNVINSLKLQLSVIDLYRFREIYSGNDGALLSAN